MIRFDSRFLAGIAQPVALAMSRCDHPVPSASRA